MSDVNGFDKQVRQSQVPPEDETLRVRNGVPGGFVKVQRGTGEVNNSTAQSGLASTDGGGTVRSDAAQEWNGEPQLHPELRGACDALDVAGRTPDNPTWPLVPAPIDFSDYNSVFWDLTAPVTISFITTGFDELAGSKRPGQLINRRQYATVAIKHNGYEVTLPQSLRYPDGDKPDLTPIEDGIHILTFMCDLFESPDGTYRGFVHMTSAIANSRQAEI